MLMFAVAQHSLLRRAAGGNHYGVDHIDAVVSQRRVTSKYRRSQGMEGGQGGFQEARRALRPEKSGDAVR